MSLPRAGTYPIDQGEAELLADADRAGGWLVFVDEVPQSYVDLSDPTYLDFEYQRLMAIVVEHFGGETPDAVHVGGAGCTLPRYLAAVRPGARQLVFERDAGLVRLAREQLALDEVPGLTVRIADGRAGIAALPGRAYDLVVLDAFAGAEVPRELLAEGFTREAARVLRAGGCYLVNVADGAPLTIARRVAATVREVFPHVLVLGEPGVLRGRRFGNLVIAGSAAPLPVAEVTRTAAGDPTPARCVDGEELDRFCLGAVPLRDDTNPIVTETPPGVLRFPGGGHGREWRGR